MPIQEEASARIHRSRLAREEDTLKRHRLTQQQRGSQHVAGIVHEGRGAQEGEDLRPCAMAHTAGAPRAHSWQFRTHGTRRRTGASAKRKNIRRAGHTPGCRKCEPMRDGPGNLVGTLFDAEKGRLSGRRKTRRQKARWMRQLRERSDIWSTPEKEQKRKTESR